MSFDNIPIELVGVSIPQAVSTVATYEGWELTLRDNRCFNTASGKYCCNKLVKKLTLDIL